MNSTEIKRMWEIFEVKENTILELRAIWPKGITQKNKPKIKHFQVNEESTIEQTKDEFEKTALALNSQGYNIYIVMNPIGPSLKGKSATDEDILCRRLLLIDIDRASDRSRPANDSEIENAYDTVKKVSAYMSANGFGEAKLVMSGNGYHLYYPLNELPNDDDTTYEITQLLKTLASKFNNEVTEIDQSVFNSSRITKVPGTIARKGEETTNRKYRMAVVQ